MPFNSVADVAELVLKQRILSMPQPDSLALLPSLPSTLLQTLPSWFGFLSSAACLVATTNHISTQHVSPTAPPRRLPHT